MIIKLKPNKQTFAFPLIKFDAPSGEPKKSVSFYAISFLFPTSLSVILLFNNSASIEINFIFLQSCARRKATSCTRDTIFRISIKLNNIIKMKIPKLIYNLISEPEPAIKYKTVFIVQPLYSFPYISVQLIILIMNISIITEKLLKNDIIITTGQSPATVIYINLEKLFIFKIFKFGRL